MKNLRSLSAFFMRRLILISFVSFCSISAFIVLTLWHDFKKRSARIRADYISTVKQQVKADVDYAAEQVIYARNELDRRLKKRLRTHVEQAYQIALSLYKKNHKTMKAGQVQELIITALRDIRLFNGRSNYFIVGSDGILHLAPAHAEYEGKRYGELFKDQGLNDLRGLEGLSKVKSYGMGSFRIEKPGEPGQYYKKLIYIKKFDPYDWFIGTGEFLDDFTAEVQDGVIDRLEKVCLKYSQYIFGATYDGLSILGPSKGKNVLKNVAPETRQVVEKLINKAKSGGGFVEYVMPEINGYNARPKISYVLPVEGWDWYIGSGVYLDEIDSQIGSLEQELLHKIYTELAVVTFIFILISIFAIIIARRFASVISNSTTRFAHLMQDASHHGTLIRVNEFDFLEFRNFARSANEMLLARVNSEVNLKATLNSIGEGVIATDLSGQVVRMNPVACELTGVAYSEDHKLAIDDVFSITDVMGARRIDLRLSEVLQPDAKTLCFDDVVLHSATGKQYNVVCSLAPVKADNQKVIGAVLAFRDRSEEVMMEESLRQRQKLEAIGQLAGGIAHDFNNMLGGIIGGAELLENYVGNNDKCNTYLGMIMRSSERAADLAGQLLAFARKQVAVFSPQDINRIIENTVDVLRSTIDKRIHIEMVLGKSPCCVVGDETMLQSVFLNIGINASHAMPEGGELSIVTHVEVLDDDTSSRLDGTWLKPGEYINIEFRDTGTGISADVLPHIFEPFFTTKGLGMGTGLGLAAAYGNIRQHNGIITVSSEEGKGACFGVILPLASSDIGKVFTAGGVVSGSGTVLLVDDEQVMRSTGKALLEGCGYQVILADNGRDALEMYKTHEAEISLVILDMVMPMMNGRDCFYELKKIAPDLRIVISSGYAANNDIDELLENGATGFIKKPFRRVELSRSVDHAMRL